VFLDSRTKRAGADIYELRLDDVLLAATGASGGAKNIHYILHTTFCCSTLLARYFEILPSCFVLKEPMLLTQLALTSHQQESRWEEAFDLGVRLLTRTYQPGEMAVIKPHEPCNSLGARLLEHDRAATITFLMTPLRHFLLAILKSDERRNWVRTRVRSAAQDAAACPPLAYIDPNDLTDPEAAAYLWLTNSFLCGELSDEYGSRVLVLDGGRLAESPEEALPQVASISGLPLDEQLLKWMIAHPSITSYSKDPSRQYDASARRKEIEELDHRWSTEADTGVEWAASITSGYELVGYE
jgi:hypothetical protein